MKNFTSILVFITFLATGFSHASECDYDIESIIKLMRAYEKQIENIRIEYEYIGPLQKNGTKRFIEGTFAYKVSDGYVLNDFINYQGTSYDDKKIVSGVAAAFDGQVTRYFEHMENKNNYHSAAIFKGRVGSSFVTKDNPYYRVWYLNYKNKFSDNLEETDSNAQVVGTEIIDDIELIKINYKGLSGFYDCNLWLAPERNYLPVKFESYRSDNGQLSWSMSWSDFEKVGNDIWYPIQIKMSGNSIDNPSQITVKNISIEPLDRKDFFIKFPELTHVTDHVLGTSYVTTEPVHNIDSMDDGIETTEISNKKKEEILNDYIEGQITSKIGNETKEKTLNNHEETPPNTKQEISKASKVLNSRWILISILPLPLLGFIKFRTKKNAS